MNHPLCSVFERWSCSADDSRRLYGFRRSSRVINFPGWSREFTSVPSALHHLGLKWLGWRIKPIVFWTLFPCADDFVDIKTCAAPWKLRNGGTELTVNEKSASLRIRWWNPWSLSPVTGQMNDRVLSINSSDAKSADDLYSSRSTVMLWIQGLFYHLKGENRSFCWALAMKAHHQKLLVLCGEHQS